MKEILKALEEKKVIQKIKLTMTIVPEPEDKTPEEIRELQKEAVRDILVCVFHEDDKLSDLFSEYCFESGMNAVCEAVLDLKDDEADKKVKELKEKFEAFAEIIKLIK